METQTFCYQTGDCPDDVSLSDYIKVLQKLRGRHRAVFTGWRRRVTSRSTLQTTSEKVLFTERFQRLKPVRLKLDLFCLYALIIIHIMHSLRCSLEYNFIWFITWFFFYHVDLKYLGCAVKRLIRQYWSSTACSSFVLRPESRWVRGDDGWSTVGWCLLAVYTDVHQSSGRESMNCELQVSWVNLLFRPSGSANWLTDLYLCFPNGATAPTHMHTHSFVSSLGGEGEVVFQSGRITGERLSRSWCGAVDAGKR